MAGERFMTQDRETIRRWVEDRGGWPATVASTRTDNDPGLIRIDFPGYSGSGSLEKISWDDWFQKFEDSDLVLLFQETLADGGQSNFNKLISRETAEENDSAEWKEGSARRQKSTAGATAGGGKQESWGGEDVNLNEASADELDGLFGIGPATAKKIVDYRDSELGGRFHSVHDLTHIPGIGEKTAEMIMSKGRVE